MMTGQTQRRVGDKMNKPVSFMNGIDILSIQVFVVYFGYVFRFMDTKIAK